VKARTTVLSAWAEGSSDDELAAEIALLDTCEVRWQAISWA
jgi:hypothetical protein